ncbi:hypothetical protein AVEN_93526-1 [Araneus ventricosus]|uniref:Uncharacterized protein n=1 Tax=Araneus ventricosus TaxID=182803 RepID=A0A4Y2APC3_ARAVE|nr:hypothetical protein AVEN_93526-1 [Araneus ventricosus]
MGPVAREIMRSGQTSSLWCGANFGEGVPAQVSSSSSDHGSKLRGPFQNALHFVSKRDVNISKLKSPYDEAKHKPCHNVKAYEKMEERTVPLVSSQCSEWKLYNSYYPALSVNPH